MLGRMAPKITIPSQADEPERFDALVEDCCEVMHDAYENAAGLAGWQTQMASRKPWADVPEANKLTMRYAVSALLISLAGRS